MRGTIIILFSVISVTCAKAAVAGGGPELPVVVLPAAADEHKPMVLLITGDGGWKGFDPMLAQQFVDKKMPVVALNALHYFWSKKTPEQATAAVRQLLIKYRRQWHRGNFILAGFSFGADIMPFIVNRLPADIMNSCKGVVLFSPGTSTDFEIHLSQMLSNRRQWAYSVTDEMKRMQFARLLCFFGDEEHDFPVGILARPGWQVVYLRGGHHYTENKEDVAAKVLQVLGLTTN